MKQSSTRTSQGGSILIFIIVAAVLGLALVGAVLFVRHKGEVAQTKVPIMGPVNPPEATPDNKQEKPQEPAANNGSAQVDNQPASQDAASHEAHPAPAAELPQTGLADVAGSSVIIALFTMAVVGYIRSRRLSWQL